MNERVVSIRGGRERIAIMEAGTGPPLADWSASGRKLVADKEGERFDRRRIEIRRGSKREA